MHESQVTSGAMLIAFILICIALCFHMTYWTKCFFGHGIFQLIAVCLTGVGMCTFRLLRGVRTNIVKYIHMVIHLIAFLIMVLSLQVAETEVGKDHVHSVAGYATAISYAVEIVFGIFFFTYLYEYRSLRLNLAPFHDVFGIFVYLSLVGCLLSGYHGICGMEVFYTFQAKVFVGVVVAAFMICVVVILSPYFEWELVGFL